VAPDVNYVPAVSTVRRDCAAGRLDRGNPLPVRTGTCCGTCLPAAGPWLRLRNRVL